MNHSVFSASMLNRNTFNVGLLGVGNVGAAVADALLQEQCTSDGRSIVLQAVLQSRNRNGWCDKHIGLVRKSIRDIVCASDIDLVCELIGGEEPALQSTRSALEDGKHIVSANKLLWAKHWPEFVGIAQRTKVKIGLEASVMGRVPIIAILRNLPPHEKVKGIRAIVNGTTNFVLRKMEEGMTQPDALTEAQRLGYAEANPEQDVRGYDAAYKSAILAGVMSHEYLDPDDIETEGINGITQEDIAAAIRKGCVIKLIATLSAYRGEIIGRVRPERVPEGHLLARINGNFNGAVIETNSQEFFLYGHGAGGGPTAAAVLSDIFAIANHPEGYRSPFGVWGHSAKK